MKKHKLLLSLFTLLFLIISTIDCSSKPDAKKKDGDSKPTETVDSKSDKGSKDSSPKDLTKLLVDFGIMQKNNEVPIDFKLEDLEGNNVALKDLKGKVVVVNFWATWCGPCIKEMPSMDKLYKDLREKGKEFVILAIDGGESKEVVQKMKEKLNVSFPILLDTNNSVTMEYGVSGIPTSFIITKDGKLIGKVVGGRDWFSKAAVDLFTQLCDE